MKDEQLIEAVRRMNATPADKEKLITRIRAGDANAKFAAHGIAMRQRRCRPEVLS